MKANVLLYPKLESNNYIYEDYTFKNYFKLIDMPESSDLNYISYIQLADDEKIENISYYTYNTEEYWDLLLLLNGVSPLYDLPKSYDYITKIIEDDIKLYFLTTFNVTISFNALNTITNTTQLAYETRALEMFNEQIIIKQHDNELYRNFKIIQAQKIQDYLSIAKNKGFL